MFLFSYTSLAAMGLFKPPLNPTPTEIPQKLVQNGRPGLERALPIWHLFNLFFILLSTGGGGGRGQIDTHFLLMYTTVKGLSHEMEFRLSNPQIDSNPVS